MTVATYAEPARRVLTMRSRTPGWLIRILGADLSGSAE